MDLQYNQVGKHKLGYDFSRNIELQFRKYSGMGHCISVADKLCPVDILSLQRIRVYSLAVHQWN